MMGPQALADRYALMVLKYARSDKPQTPIMSRDFRVDGVDAGSMQLFDVMKREFGDFGCSAGLPGILSFLCRHRSVERRI